MADRVFRPTERYTQIVEEIRAHSPVGLCAPAFVLFVQSPPPPMFSFFKISAVKAEIHLQTNFLARRNPPRPCMFQPSSSALGSFIVLLFIENLPVVRFHSVHSFSGPTDGFVLVCKYQVLPQLYVIQPKPKPTRR